MATREQEIQIAEKRELTTGTEQLHEGPVFQPAVDIFEKPDSITIVADMPGVKPDELTIDLRNDVLTIRGPVQSPEGEPETAVLREFSWGNFFRQFTLAETIDQAKIEARLSDGVLRLELPKVEKAKPRQIVVKTA
ncbi:MAG: Hsp20/alpha crystallin family protein [Bryobacterales bacterium]|nr:Hsp20/alpha crystallin family protein [Bryobacterales bacterium]